MNANWEQAARKGDAESLAAQLASGAEVDSLDRYGQSALMLAVRSGSEESVQVLVDAGADLNITAKYGLSAIMLAVVYGHEGIARILLEAGADLSITGTGAPGFQGKTAADLARASGLAQLATELSLVVHSGSSRT